MNGPSSITSDTTTSNTSVVNDIIKKIKSQGLFDKFRKECLADIDTKPAYRNLQQRVETYVSRFLGMQVWTPKTNKNQMRDLLRKHINQSPLLTNGVQRIVEQTLNPKIFTTIKPRIDEVVCEYLGIDYYQRKREIEEQRDSQRHVHSHNVPQQLMAIDPSYVPSASASPPSSTQSTQPAFQQGWQQYPPFYQASPYMGVTDYTMPYGVPQPYMQQWPMSQQAALAAPGTEDTLIPQVIPNNGSSEPQDMDLCDELPEPPPLPPEPEPPPDDGDDPPLPPPEPPDEDEEIVTPPLLTDLGIPIGDGDENDEAQVTEEIVEMEIPCDDGNIVQTIPLSSESTSDKPEDVAKYHFDWTNEIDVDDISDVGSVSSIHTSDLSSGEDDDNSSDDAEVIEKTQDLDMTEIPIKEENTEETVTVEGDDGDNVTVSDTPYMESLSSQLSRRHLMSLQYNYSDSEDEETREERQIRITRDKEERFIRRQQRRAELDQKRKDKELKKSHTIDVASEVDSLEAVIASSDEVINESPTKISPQKPRKTKAQRKEELREQKVNEKRLALRRQRTRNKRYTSAEFTSIFTDSKRPFGGHTYEPVLTVEEFCADGIVVCEEVTETVEDIENNEIGDDLEGLEVIDTLDVKDEEEISEEKTDKLDYEIEESTREDATVENENDKNNAEEYENVDKNEKNEGKGSPEKSVSIHNSRAESPFSDVSDISLSESFTVIDADEGDDEEEKQEPGGTERGRNTRSQRYNIDDLYKPRTSHRRYQSHAESSHLNSRNKSSSKPTKTTHSTKKESQSITKDTSKEPKQRHDFGQDPLHGDGEYYGNRFTERPRSLERQSSRSLSRSRSLSSSRSRSRSPSKLSPSKHRHHHKSHHRKHRKRKRSLHKISFGMAAQQARIRDRIYNTTYTTDMKYTEAPRSPPRWEEQNYPSPHSGSPRSRSGSHSSASNESVLLAARRTDYHRRTAAAKLEHVSDEESDLRPISPDGSLHSDTSQKLASRECSLSPPQLQPASPRPTSPYLQAVSREQSEGEISDASETSPRRVNSNLHEDNNDDDRESGEYIEVRSPVSSHRSPISRKRYHRSPEVIDRDSPPRRHSRRHISPPRRYTPSPPHSRRIPHMSPLGSPMMHPHGIPMHRPYPPIDPHLEPPMYPLPPYDPMMRMPLPHRPASMYPYGMMMRPEGPSLPKRPRH